MRRSIAHAATAALSVFCASLASATVVTISDADFAPADWNHTTVQFGPFGGAGSAGQTASGRTGTGWRISNVANPGGSGAWNASVYQPFTYNPAFAPITDLALSIDTRFVDTLQAVSFILQQGGHLWRIGYYLNTQSWTTFALTNPQPSDFAPLTNGAPALPDLTTTGAPVKFGIAAGNSGTVGSYSTQGFYDNFSVTFVPAPGTIALAACAIAAARVRRRR